MLETPQTHNIERSPRLIEAALKISYVSMLAKRYPFRNAEELNETDEEKLFYHLEKFAMEEVKYLNFPSLKEYIPEKHHDKLEHFWNYIKEFHGALLDSTEALESHRDPSNTPISAALGAAQLSLPLSGKESELPEEEAKELNEIAKLIRGKLPPHLRETTSLLIDTSDSTKEWREIDKKNRFAMYESHRKFLKAWKDYIAMLLVKSPDGEEFVLPEKHFPRQHLIHKLVLLGFVSSTHQGMHATKTTIHNMKGEGGNRVRKTKLTASIDHSTETTFRAIYDVFPHIAKTPAVDMTTITSVMATHDLIEETDQSPEEIIKNYLARFMDTYDTVLDPHIQSGFELSREQMKHKILNLLGMDSLSFPLKEPRRNRIKRQLRIISNNTQLSRPNKEEGIEEDEIKNAMENPIAGFETTRIILGLPIEEAQEYTPHKNKTSKTFKKFKEADHNHDNQKLTKFLIRMHAITKDEVERQEILIAKLEDRAYNIDTLEGMPLEKQLNTLRATTVRLIAWCMLDHDNKKYPLYNALPRLIDSTLNAYYRLRKQHPEEITEKDESYIAQLEKWKTKVIRFDTQQKIAELFALLEPIKPSDSQ